MSDSSHSSIAVDGLAKTYGDVEALRGIEFRVEPGEIVGFVGPNGAGKTTTMKILSCVVAPTAGTARVAGHDVRDEPEAVRRNIGYLPENVPLYEEMLVYDYLKFVADIQEIDAAERTERIREVAKLTGLTGVVDRTIRDLSKGFRQRVGLAQAIIHRPDVVILDEPTTGLDPNQIVEIRDVLTAIGGDNAILLSTHILQEVSAICDRIVIIDEGRIVGDGTLDELREPIAASDAGLLVEYWTDRPEALRAELRDLESIDRITDHETRADRVSFRLDGDPTRIRTAIVELEADSPRGLTSIEPIDLDLEEIFRQYTTGVPPGAPDPDEDINPLTDLSNWIDPHATDDEDSGSEISRRNR